MFNFSRLKIGLKILIAVLAVEVISLVSGVTMGRNIHSPMVILGCLSTVLVSQYIGWMVCESINKSVKRVLDDLSGTSNDLTSTSKGITEVSHKLAEGSSEQAASIQETSSTLEESASMVHQTTQNTKEADALAKQATGYADKGNSEMQTMLTSMEELKKSSTEIGKIIKVIDEIAFQTNILSLNAAVEAARAGDAGKGFAVVAEEVRNLAQRSAQAAKDTTVIIESNIDLSEKCLLVTEKVGASLVSITDETHKVSRLLEEISTASQEQEIGIGQINQAISQMEHVIHANASTAQESASSADKLTVYSETIQLIMDELSSLIYGEDGAKKSSFKMPIIKTKQAAVVKKPVEKVSSKRNWKRPATVVAAAPRVEKIETAKSSAKSAVRPEDIIPLDDF